tara:strand:- start:6933 stop:7835 length:903 start_codon:yes stop_codon:yes gene_type:complete
MPSETTDFLLSTVTTSSIETRIVEEIHFMTSDLENIDNSLYSYINDKLNIHTTTNKGWRKTPVIWLSAERAYQIKHNKDLRDISGSFIMPAITIERSSVVKDPTKRGSFYSNIPPVNDEKGGSITFVKQINQDKTQNFAIADSARASTFGTNTNQLNFPGKNKKIVYNIISVPMPVYINLSYVITLRTEYQQQMNELINPFITVPGGINYVSLIRNGHLYEGLIQQDFVQENNASSLGEDERMYQTKINIDVTGYLIGENDNQKTPKIVVRENAVDIKMPRERRLTQDEIEKVNSDAEYR